MALKNNPRVEIAKAMLSLIRPYYKEGERRIKRARRPPRPQEKARNEDVTLKEATFVVMEEAVAHVSGGGQLPVGVRRLYYAVRNRIQRYTSKELTYKYFKDLLLEYQDEHGPIPGLYYDPRGRLYEPHTESTLDLGTREVAAYKPPLWVYDKILYVEKRGQWPLLDQAQFRERYDMAIITGEGFATEAARNLIRMLQRGRDYQIFVLHDCDHSGYDIARTLREATRRMPDYYVDVMDLGLTAEEAVTMGLEPEEYTRKSSLSKELLSLLDEPGNELAQEWFAGEKRGNNWLCKRVELDQMSAPQEVEYIERKLVEAGVRGKVIPPEEELPKLAEGMYRREHGLWVEEALRDLVSIDEVKEELADRFMEEFELESARRSIEESFEEDRTLSWRSAFEKKLGVTQENHADALKEAVRMRAIEALEEK
jgi:hypothetical protein